MGIHPHDDFGLIPNEKNSDLVRIGYANINGFTANMIGNEKVNAIRRYARKHDLDAFFGVEANINWKKMPEEGPSYRNYSIQRMPYVLLLPIPLLKIGAENSREAPLA